MDGITHELLTRMFRFDLEAGRLFWREPPRNHMRLLGKEAGSPRAKQTGKRYWHVKIERRAIKRSHIIFFVTRGFWPSPCVDHIDGNSENDSIHNIRQATVTQNAWNHKGRRKSSCLPMGIRMAPSGRFHARLACNKTKITVGTFDTVDEAAEAYAQKRKEMFGEYA